MKEIKFLFFSFLVLILSGCISIENVFKSQTEETQSFTTQVINAELNVFPEKVKSGESLKVYLLLKNTREKEMKNIIVCVYGTGTKECKGTDLKTEKELVFSFKAPEVAKDIELEETLYARVYLLDNVSITLQLPVIDENEYLIRKRSGKIIESYTVSKENGYLDLQPEIKDYPVISKNGEAEFTISLNIRKTGSGGVFNPASYPSKPELKELSFDEIGKAFMKIKAPSAIQISCEKEKTTDGYKIELFRGEDSVICKCKLKDTSITTAKIYPIIFQIVYGYYFEVSTTYKVKGD